MTEEDTFIALARTSYVDTYNAYKIWWESDRPRLWNEKEADEFLKPFMWTYGELCKEYDAHAHLGVKIL